MLSVPIYTEVSDFEHDHSKLSTERLYNKIIEQDINYELDIEKKKIKNEIKFLQLSY